MELIVRNIQENEASKFESLSKEYGTLFTREHWLSLNPYAERLGIFQNDGQMVGGLAVQVQKLGPFKALTNPVFSANCGLFLHTKGENPSRVTAWHKAAGNALSEYLGQRPEALIDLSFPPEFSDVQAFHWKGFRTIPAYTYRLNLRASEEELMAGMDAKRRNRIKKLQEEGAVVHQSKDAVSVCDVILGRKAEKGLAEHSLLQRSIVERGLEQGWGIGYLCYSEKNMLAASFCAGDEKVMYYLLGGIKSSGSEGGASLVLWVSILDAKKAGFSTFDFEGSMVPEIEHFFRGFGGSLTPYYRIKKASLWMEGLLRIFRPGIWH